MRITYLGQNEPFDPVAAQTATHPRSKITTAPASW
jgi:hypothetical protein